MSCELIAWQAAIVMVLLVIFTQNVTTLPGGFAIIALLWLGIAFGRRSITRHL